MIIDVNSVVISFGEGIFRDITSYVFCRIHRIFFISFQEADMEDFIEKFTRMIDYGFLGIYKRQKMHEESVKTRFVPAITKA